MPRPPGRAVGDHRRRRSEDRSPTTTCIAEGMDEHRFCTDEHGPRGRWVWCGRAQRLPRLHRSRHAVVVGGEVPPAHRRRSGGIWHDMNEPTSIALLGDPTLPRSHPPPLRRPGWRPRRGPQPLRVAHEPRRVRRPARRPQPNARPFIVSRSGWAGMQRWAWNWTGDVASTLGVDAPADRHRGRARPFGGPVLGIRHRRLQRTSPTTSCTCAGCR